MKIADISLLFDYHYWGNQRILAAAAGLSQEQFLTPPGHGLESLRAILSHCIDAEYGWRTLWETGTIDGFETFNENSFSTLDELARRWAEEEQAMRAWLAGLTDDDLGGLVRYAAWDGAKRERILWHTLWHTVNHGTQHRSEAAAILTGYGCSPGDLDFTVFLNSRKRGT